MRVHLIVLSFYQIAMQQRTQSYVLSLYAAGLYAAEAAKAEFPQRPTTNDQRPIIRCQMHNPYKALKHQYPTPPCLSVPHPLVLYPCNVLCGVSQSSHAWTAIRFLPIPKSAILASAKNLVSLQMLRTTLAEAMASEHTGRVIRKIMGH